VQHLDRPTCPWTLKRAESPEYLGRHAAGNRADVLCENDKMLRVFEKSGCQITKKAASGAYEIVMLFS
jgi:hypothetical protein